MSAIMEDELKTPTAQARRPDVEKEQDMEKAGRSVYIAKDDGKGVELLVPSVELVSLKAEPERKQEQEYPVVQKKVVSEIGDDMTIVDVGVYRQFERESSSSVCNVFDTSGVERYRTGAVPGSGVVGRPEGVDVGKKSINTTSTLNTPIAVSAGSALMHSKRSEGSAVVAEIAARQQLYEPVQSSLFSPSLMYGDTLDQTQWWASDSVTARVNVASEYAKDVFEGVVAIHLKCTGLEAPTGASAGLVPFACLQRERESVGAPGHTVWDTFCSSSTVNNALLGQRQKLAAARALAETTGQQLQDITSEVLGASADFPALVLPLQTLLTGDHIRVLVLHQDSIKSRPCAAAVQSTQTLRNLVMQAVYTKEPYCYVQPLHSPYNNNNSETQNVSPRLYISVSAPLFNITNAVAMTPLYKPIVSKQATIQLTIQTLGPILGLTNSSEKRFASSAYQTFKTYVKESEDKVSSKNKYQRVLCHYTPVQTSTGVLTWHIVLPVALLTGGQGDYDQQIRISIMDALVHTQGYKETAFCVVSVRELVLMGTHPWMLYSQEYDIEDRAIHVPVKSVYRKTAKKSNAMKEEMEMDNMGNSRSERKLTVVPTVADNGCTDIDTTSQSTQTRMRPGYLGTTSSSSTVEELQQGGCVSDDDSNQKLIVAGCLLVSNCRVQCSAVDLEQIAAAQVHVCNHGNRADQLSKDEWRVTAVDEKFEACLLDSYAASLAKSSLFTTGTLRASELHKQKHYMASKLPSLLHAYLAHINVPKSVYAAKGDQKAAQVTLQTSLMKENNYEQLAVTAEQYISDSIYDKNYKWNVSACGLPGEGCYRLEVYAVRQGVFYLYKTSVGVNAVNQGNEWIAHFSDFLLPMLGCVENSSGMATVEQVPQVHSDSRVDYYIKKRDLLRKKRFARLQARGVDLAGVSVHSSLTAEEQSRVQHALYWDEEFPEIMHDILDIAAEVEEEEREVDQMTFQEMISQEQAVVLVGEHRFVDYNRVLLRVARVTPTTTECAYGPAYTGAVSKKNTKTVTKSETITAVFPSIRSLQFDKDAWQTHACGRPAEVIGLGDILIQEDTSSSCLGQSVVFQEDVKKQAQEQRRNMQLSNIQRKKLLLSELAAGTTHQANIDFIEKQDLLFRSEMDTQLVHVGDSVSAIALPLVVDGDISLVSLEIKSIQSTTVKDKKFR